MAMTNHATARYEGLGTDGKGYVSMGSGALKVQPYGFNTRFEDEPGTNPEEQIAAAHASCFTMALSIALSKEGLSQGTLSTRSLVTLEKEGEGFKVASSELTLDAYVKGIDRARFEAIADEAKANCPISKLLNCEISLTVQSFES